MRVPEGWSQNRIGELCSSIVPGRNKPKLFDGDIPWVTTPEIQGRYLPSKLQKNYISSEEIKLSGGKLVPKNAVIMAAVGDLGLVAIAQQDIVINQQLHAFVCLNEVFYEYIAYWIEIQKPYMFSIASKTTIPYLNKNNCESIPVNYPPLPEQQKIAQILSTWDKAIGTTEQLLANSQQQKKALMQQLLTGKKRLLDGDGVRFGGEWNNVKLRSIFSSEHIKSQNSGFPLYSVTKNGLVNQELYFNKSVASEDTTNYKVVKQGNFVMSGLNFWMGSVDVHMLSQSVIVSPAYKVYRILSGTTPEYIKCYVTSSAFKKILEASSVTGASIVRRNFSESIFNNSMISLPCKEEQQKIATVLSTADRDIELLQTQLEALKHEKKALMQQLLTGKRRVTII